MLSIHLASSRPAPLRLATLAFAPQPGRMPNLPCTCSERLPFPVSKVFTISCHLPPDAQYGVTITPRAWWEEFIGKIVECSFFLGSVLLGVGLLRRWRRAHIVAVILGASALAVYVWLVSSPLNPHLTLTQRLLYLSPLAILGLYSLIAVSFMRYEPRVT
jgi:hypothetical protein